MQKNADTYSQLDSKRNAVPFVPFSVTLASGQVYHVNRRLVCAFNDRRMALWQPDTGIVRFLLN